MTIDGGARVDAHRTAESAWLLDCVQAFVQESAGGKAATAAAPTAAPDPSRVDWEALVMLADRHGATSLLHRRIESAWRDRVPKQTRAALRARYIERVGLNLRRSSELIDLVHALGAQGMRTVPY